jgi:transposase
MSLRLPQPVPPVPDDTARLARAAFPRGNPYVLLRNRLGPVFDDAGFADLYPRRGQPAYTPWRLALVTLMQFREGLSDRQAAEAVRARIDWKYLLALDLADAGFDHTVLCEFRGRLLDGDASERLLARVLDTAREAGLLKVRGRQRTDSTHGLAAVRDLNRIELLAETLRAALNAIAVIAPDWLRALAPPEWHARYDRRIEDSRLPESGPKREAYVAQVGADGLLLLNAIDRANAPGPMHRRRSPRCPRLPCCAGCGRGTSSGMRMGQITVRPSGMGSDCGRCRAVAPGTASSRLTTPTPASGPRPA